MTSSERKKGIAGNRATRRKVNLTGRQNRLSAKPPRPALPLRTPQQYVNNVRRTSRSQRKSQNKKSKTEREIHGLTIPQIAWLKQNDTDDYDAFLASLTDAEFLDVMELDIFGEFNVKY